MEKCIKCVTARVPDSRENFLINCTKKMQQLPPKNVSLDEKIIIIKDSVYPVLRENKLVIIDSINPKNFDRVHRLRTA